MAKRASNRATKTDEQKSEDATTATETEVAKSEEAESKTETSSDPEKEPASEVSETESDAERDPVKEDFTTPIIAESNEESKARWESNRRYGEVREVATRLYISKLGSMNTRGFDASHYIKTTWAEAEAFVEYAESKAPGVEE